MQGKRLHRRVYAKMRFAKGISISGGMARAEDQPAQRRDESASYRRT